LVDRPIVFAHARAKERACSSCSSSSATVDSYQIAVGQDAKVGNLAIKRFGFAVGDWPPGPAIASEFGLSLHAASSKGGEKRNAVSGVDKVHAIIGGLRLIPYNEDYVREVIAALIAINPDFIIPLHCTGEAFYEMMKVAAPAKLVRSYTGTQFVFAA
jgi:hypothetical protein